MAKPLAVLIVEDNKSDAQLLVRILTKAGYTLTYEHVDTGPQMLAALEKQTWDIVISDFSMPELDGHASLKILQETGLDIPFIVVSGTMGEETAVAMMKAGAHDYVMKGNLARLVPAVERELSQAKLRLERKQAEEALHESEEKFRKSMEFTPIPTAVAKNNGDLVFLNKHFMNLYGYTLQDLPTIEKWFVLAYPDIKYRNSVLDDWGKRVEDALNNNVATIPAEYLTTCKNGDVRTVEISAYFEKDFSIGLFQDITERKQAEEKLIASEKNFRQIAENIKEVFWISAPDWSKIYYISPTYYDVWGEEAEKLYEQPFLWIDSIIEEDKEKVRSCIPETITKDIKEIIFPDYRIKKSDGAIIWISARAFPIFDSEGNPHRIVGIAEDITARKQIEEEIRKMNDELESRVRGRTAQLEASNKELEAFSHSVSHDLRAPLRSIEGFSQALLEEYRENLDETGRNYLDRVCEAAKLMGRLIDDTLKLSRVARFDFQCAAVDLSRMVRVIAEANQKNYHEGTVEVTVQEGIIVQGDPHLMKIALGNLLDNAWKFTGKAIQPRIEFGKTVKDDEAAYYVRDNGAGFDMAYVDKLFGPFQRLHTTEEFAGTGIGLATVKRIIARHGGQVWAEGEVGNGATFYFTLPS